MTKTIASYYFVCAGWGAFMGAHGFPLFWGEFFYYPLWATGAALLTIGFLLFE